MIEPNCDGDATKVPYEAVPSSWTLSLVDLRNWMTLVDKHVHKQITRPGDEERDPVPDKARVSIRYRAYWEGHERPFEASRLREFETGGHMVLKGLEAAVRTMRPYEQAEFVISHELLYGELGCLPLIQPMANGLFQVEVIDYWPIKQTERWRNEFNDIYPEARELHRQGRMWVRRLQLPNAVSVLRKGIESLSSCRVNSAEEHRQRADQLVLLYQGLMVCFNGMGRPNAACEVMKKVRRLTGNNPPWRTLCQEGRALFTLGHFERAHNAFSEAQKMQPNNYLIRDEIINISKWITVPEASKLPFGYVQ
ncbi:inactive peptidyl-prolyl cis-trans isomerase shutdown-like [Drosophila rhopaloa]|uniref:peptidylprolyl isomerase n=1 Tax=Drosophila rhopaloa TaxID=1041015 RepID=A0A6P4EK60_DRORH|nr:inactive peptidyl-prolyl cis-trans isomerase shutdown-like [Drosophila rhopaloa]